MKGWGIFEATRIKAALLNGRGPEPEKFVIGLDLGKANDPSALVVARRVMLYAHEMADIDGSPSQPMGGLLEHMRFRSLLRW
jgi:hypothetical protein